MISSISSLNKTMLFITINLDQEITIQQIMHQQKLLNKYEMLATKISSLAKSTLIHKTHLKQ